jgi:hypothetical protein
MAVTRRPPGGSEETRGRTVLRGELRY